MSVEHTTTENRQQVKRNPYTPWFVIMIFTAPVLGAYLLYFFGDVASYGNNGELLDPVVDFAGLEMVDAADEPFTTDSLERRWHLVYFAGAGCDERCVKTLTGSRQVNIAVGKNANRLRRLIVHVDEPDAGFQELVDTELPNAIRVFGDAGNITEVLAPVDADLARGDLYLVDPLGNIMMRFEPGMNPKLMMKDLNRLFKVSQIG